MGLFKDPPPTATDPIEDNGSDPEKAPIPAEQGSTSSPGAAHHHVNPEVEKRVVRKLDLRFTTLVGFLCTLIANRTCPYVDVLMIWAKFCSPIWIGLTLGESG